MRPLFTATLASFVLTLLLSVPSSGQEEKTDYDRYVEAAGDRLPVLRAKRAQRYSFAYSGTPYHDPNGFKDGEACICGKVYRNLIVNYNVNLQSLEVRSPESPLTRTYDTDDVDWFIRDGVKYINLRKEGHDVKEGFFEIVYDGKDKIYRRIDKSIDVNTFSNIVNIGYTDPNYDDSIISFFNFKESWYLESGDGELFPFKNSRFLFKKYPGSKRIAKARLPYFNESDHAFWYSTLMTYIENEGGNRP